MAAMYKTRNNRPSIIIGADRHLSKEMLKIIYRLREETEIGFIAEEITQMLRYLFPSKGQT